MEEKRIDITLAALKLIEILYMRGEINQATYANILRHSTSYISHSDKKVV